MDLSDSSVGAPIGGPRGGLQEKVLGGLAIVLIAAALYLLIAGAVREEEVLPVPSAPPVTIVAPQSGVTTGRAIELRFTAEEPLSVQPGGWGVGGMHLHADVGGQEVMPSPSDIVPLQDGSYRWIVQAADTGAIAVRLFWSDEAHVPIPLSATEDVFLTVR